MPYGKLTRDNSKSQYVGGLTTSKKKKGKCHHCGDHRSDGSDGNSEAKVALTLCMHVQSQKQVGIQRTGIEGFKRQLHNVKNLPAPYMIRISSRPSC